MEPPDESRDPKQFRVEEKSVDPSVVEPWKKTG
jgi:hypothetical protein